MLKQINIRNGKVIVDFLSKNEDNVIYNVFDGNKSILKIEYAIYLVDVRYKKGMFDILIFKKGESKKPIIKQEVGDYESLIFTLQNYIDLLASFKENNHI